MVYAYHSGKATDTDFLVRPRRGRGPTNLCSWHTTRRVRCPGSNPPDGPAGTPKVHFKPIAAGEVVLDSQMAPLARYLHLRFNDAVAIEMESAGVSQASHLNRSLPTLTIRGISDRTDGQKDIVDAGGSQAVASAHAAAFAVALASGILAGHARDGSAARGGSSGRRLGWRKLREPVTVVWRPESSGAAWITKGLRWRCTSWP